MRLDENEKEDGNGMIRTRKRKKMFPLSHGMERKKV
jgi:hypothetical protein